MWFRGFFLNGVGGVGEGENNSRWSEHPFFGSTFFRPAGDPGKKFAGGPRPPLQQRNRIHIDKHPRGSEFSVLNVLPKPPEQMMKRRSRRRFDQQLLPVHAFDPL